MEINKFQGDINFDKLFKIPKITSYSSFEYLDNKINFFQNYQIGLGERNDFLFIQCPKKFE